MEKNYNLVNLDVPCLLINTGQSEKKLNELKNLQLSYHDKKKQQELESQAVDHTVFQQHSKFGVPKPLIVSNAISSDFVKGVMKNLTCPIC